MAVLTATSPFNAAALGTLLDINGPATLVPVNPHLVRLVAPPYKYDLSGNFVVPLTASHVTSLTVWKTTPNPDLKLYSLTGFNVTVAQVQAATTDTAIENLFFGHADTFKGSAGADKFFGFGGADVMIGNGGNDRLTGGIGKDILNGGLGADVFDFNDQAESSVASFDTIQLFSHAQHDKIDLRTIDPIPGGSDDAFLFAGAQTFANFHLTHLGAPAVRAVAGVVQVDVNGDNTVDMVIKTPGVTLHAGDFIL